MDTSPPTPLAVSLSPVARQIASVRPGEPLWAGPGAEIFELLPGGTVYVGFVPEAQIPDVLAHYRARGISVHLPGLAS